MKKTITILTCCIIVILILSSCSAPIKVNEKLNGEGDDWTVYYKIKGNADAELDNNDVYKYISDGTYYLQIEYKGDSKDLLTINEFAVSGPGIEGFLTQSDGPILMHPILSRRGTPSAEMLVHFYYNDEHYITIEWHGEINGKETIILN